MDNAKRNDRISALPDDVLLHVLSFPSTKQALQTCILAKRWRNTWMSVPSLKFDLDEFLAKCEDLIDDEKRKEYEDKFVRFVNGVLGVLEKINPLYLDTVQYEWFIGEKYSEVSMEWLDRIALLEPRVINVLIFRKNVLDTPDLVFSCASLQELELNLYTSDLRTVIQPTSINLPVLKVLELHSVKLEDDFAQKLFLGRPALQSLSLHFCDMDFSDISSKVLKSLVLEECDQFNHLQICCPNLSSLDIYCLTQTKGISLINTTSLENADITLNTFKIVFTVDLNLLGGLSEDDKAALLQQALAMSMDDEKFTSDMITTDPNLALGEKKEGDTGDNYTR